LFRAVSFCYVEAIVMRMSPLRSGRAAQFKAAKEVAEEDRSEWRPLQPLEM
jgi:hypothetical protein